MVLRANNKKYFAISLLLLSCQAETKFNASNGGVFDTKRAAVDTNATSTGGSTLALSCGEGTQTAPNAATFKKMTVPIICAQTLSGEETKRSNGDLEVVFVLDTTGSMQPYVQMVRESLHEIANAAQAGGRKARFAAISFGDTILDTRPLSENIEELFAATVETNPLWNPVAGGGGTAPEVGLLAIETGLALLAKGGVSSKTLVYLSDGPAKIAPTARESLAASFAIGATAQKMRTFASATTAQGGTFRIISATSCKRFDSWFSEWPTPCRQMQTLAQTSGVRHLLLPFPMHSFNYQAEFVEKVQTASQTITVDCKLESLAIVDKNSQAPILPETKVSGESTLGLWSIPIEKIPAGSYTAKVTRRCKTAANETKIEFTVNP